ncbi:hypothetical protein NUW54_g2874 [Trametes sanguinea]|uniref:Uncharacterized protein n=1 Tax=Trametes sanguinea TaxID=158606 RepID=A0ACC1Q3P5_9APHY|nr:hypothetical protein NUW54_g2874 [Trametes sanguinea]
MSSTAPTLPLLVPGQIHRSHYPSLYDDALPLQDAWMEQLQTFENHAKLEESLQQADVSHDVRSLNGSILEMKEAFRTLSSDFATHDFQLQSILGDHGATQGGILPLRPRWEKLRDRFVVLVDQSHASARQASATLKQYVYLFTDGNVRDSRRCAALRVELDNLLSVIQAKIHGAHGTDDSFASLANAIRDFEARVRSAISAVNAQSTVVYNHLVQTSEKLRILRSRLTKASEEVWMHWHRHPFDTETTHQSPVQLVDLGMAVITRLSTGALSAGMLFIKFSPEAAQAVVTSLLSTFAPAKAALQKLIETIKLRKSVRESERQLAAAQRKYGTYKFVEQSLAEAACAVDVLAARIDDMSNIWYLIKMDMLDIRSELCHILQGTPITEMFAQKLCVTRGVYRRLIDTLDIFARGTDV